MIQVLERFHAIMELMAEDPERPRVLGELAEHVGVSAPACSNIVRTMVELGYLHSLGLRRGYLPGPALYRLGMANPFRHLSDAAAPAMEALAARRNLMVVLVAESGGRRLELRRMDRGSSITIRPRQSTDRHYSLFHCATGALLLGGMDAQRVETLWGLHNGGERNILDLPDRAAFHARCIEMAKAGAVVIEADEGHSATMAFPLHARGRTIAALGAMVDYGDLPEAERQSLVADVRRTAASVDEALNP